MSTHASLICSCEGESTKLLQFSGRGRHEIRIVRNTAITEYVSGTVSIKNLSKPGKLLKEAFCTRSGRGGFRHIIAIEDDDIYELKVSGSARSLTSELFGCSNSGIAISISTESEGKWLVGVVCRSRVEWKAFTRRADAEQYYNDAWWSKVLFSPLGVIIRSALGPLDFAGKGIIEIEKAFTNRQASVGSTLSFSLKETRAGLAAEYPEEGQAGFEGACARSQAALSDFAQTVADRALCPSSPQQAASPRSETESAAGSHGSQPSDPVIEFVVDSLAELLAEMETKLQAAGVEQIQAERLTMIDSAGVVVEEWPDSDARFPIRVRYLLECRAPLSLVEHGQLVHDIYAAEGVDVVKLQAKAVRLLRNCGLAIRDNGERNVDEQGRHIYNQCFYLSIARGYLGHTSSKKTTRELALKLKRSIESAVISEHAHRAQDIGEEVQAFADFLPLAMCKRNGNNFLSELAVCILDSCSGHAEMYVGSAYEQITDRNVQRRNLIVLWYTPGHYQTVVNHDGSGSKIAMTYQDLKKLLDVQDIKYIETLE